MTQIHGSDIYHIPVNKWMHLIIEKAFLTGGKLIDEEEVRSFVCTTACDGCEEFHQLFIIKHCTAAFKIFAHVKSKKGLSKEWEKFLRLISRSIFKTTIASFLDFRTFNYKKQLLKSTIRFAACKYKMISFIEGTND